MSLNRILGQLLDRIETDDLSTVIGWDEVRLWPEGTLALLLKCRLLERHVDASSLECHACEHRCFSEVVRYSADPASRARAFIVCEEPDMQQQMGRVNVPLERLQQWKTSLRMLANVLVHLLGLNEPAEHSPKSGLYTLGFIRGSTGRRAVSLRNTPLTLLVNQHEIPLRDVFSFSGEQLILDRAVLAEVAAMPSVSKQKDYEPQIDKQEARKQSTQAMYKDWQDKYCELRSQYPERSASWISKYIAKLDIGKGKGSETIRKNMIP